MLNDFSIKNIIFGIAIVTFIGYIGIGVFAPIQKKVNSLDAKSQLKQIHTLQNIYRMEFQMFTSSFEELDFEKKKLNTEGGHAIYDVKITKATNNEFTAVATSTFDSDNDGVFDIWSIDESGELKNIQKD